MDDPSDLTPPEVNIEPADNGFVVRHYQRSGKKDQSGRTVRRVASTVGQALNHAKTALSGAGGARAATSPAVAGINSVSGAGPAVARSPKKKSSRGTQLGQAEGVLGAQSIKTPGSGPGRNTARRRRPRVGGRR